MDFRYSSILDPSTYTTQGLCDGIQLRLHNDHEVEDLAIIRAQEDWRQNVAPIGLFRGCLHPSTSFVSLCMPECLPERLDIVCYANEFGFLHDDVFDKAEKAKGDKALNEMIEGFQAESTNGSAHEEKSSGKKRLQSKMVLEMLSIDRERALTAIQMWTKFLERGRGGGETRFHKLADFIEYRIEDIGKTTWSGLIMFGCAITIPDHEMQASSDLCRPAWIALALTNDLFSWDKEHRDAVDKGQTYVCNALCVIMQEHSVSLEEAKETCRKEIRESVKEYLDVVKRAKQENKYSIDLLRFMDGLVYSVGGNLVWSTTCPRYHADAQFSAQQVEWMTNGIPDHLRRKKPVKALQQQPKTNEHTNGGPDKRPGQTMASANTNGIHDLTKKQKANHGVNSGVPVKDLADILTNRHLPDLPTDIIDGPSKYIASLPGKGVRSRVIDALNIWFDVPEPTIIIIKRIVDLLHQASLMLDDIQDSSPLRRGKPATHTIFGLAQTINSSSYKISEALEEVLKLENMECVRIVIEESKRLYIGQSLDLHWTGNLVCPSVGEYIKALDDKTGGLIRMLTRLQEATSPLVHKPNIRALATMLGRCYALRDDYKNLSSTEYTQTKGFCEDLDEGKYSLPIIHALHTLTEERSLVLRNILTQRRLSGGSTLEHKALVLELLAAAGSLPYTLDALRLLQDQMDMELEAVEAETGRENFELRAVIEMVKV